MPARGELVALAIAPTGQSWIAGADADTAATPAEVARLDAATSPRWVVWSAAESARLLAAGTSLRSCWDLAAVHRLQAGGWRSAPGRVWARHRNLPLASLPEASRGAAGVVDLFTAADLESGDADEPVRPDGHLRPDWGGDDWQPTQEQLRRWAHLALQVGRAQAAERAEAPQLRATLVARSESTAELLGNELSASGLPLELAIAEEIIAAAAGPRPRDAAEADAIRRARDDEVLRHVPGSNDFDLRNPAQVKSVLRRVGIEVEDTRAWRLESLVGAHPVVEPLLRWRKAERIATTFGYQWLDHHVSGGRLRGSWTGSDGAAGRMTASAGLHNMTAELRPAVMAETGHVFIRSDLGQIEPRVLAVASGDPRLARASATDDLYAEVATTLGVERDIAKVAVLGAMYGQTTGRGAQALAQLRTTYPVAMAYLDEADKQARLGRDVFTYGGRRVRMDNSRDSELGEAAARSRVAARGRYGRNAVVQGAAAELFKMWAVTVRARLTPLDAEVVLCLHDELLVHAPIEAAAAAAEVVDSALQEAVARWAPDDTVRFLADTSTIARWSDAKD